MIKIINSTNQLSAAFINGTFDLSAWEKYIDSVLPDHKDLFLNDMNEVLGTDNYTFEKDYAPVLNNVIKFQKQLEELTQNFNLTCQGLDEKITNLFGRSPDVIILLYLGLCNGAGWVVKLENQQYILLGVEKILELGWYDVKNMYALIYHELGHIFQMQFGNWNNPGKDRYLWQLFTEGIAMFFEQKLLGDDNFFHQDKDGWLSWCENHLSSIKKDFNCDIAGMNPSNQRYFGDWVNYNNNGDVGYFLGTRFVQFLNNSYTFDEMINFDIDKVKLEWGKYLK